MPSRPALRLVAPDDPMPARPPFDLNQALIELGEYFRQNPMPPPAVHVAGSLLQDRKRAAPQDAPPNL